MKQITREIFEKKYFSMKLKDLAKELGVSVQMVSNYRRMFNIEKKGRSKKIIIVGE